MATRPRIEYVRTKRGPQQDILLSCSHGFAQDLLHPVLLPNLPQQK